jgi:hypothetical protein
MNKSTQGKCMKLYFTLDYLGHCLHNDAPNQNFTSLRAIGGTIQYFSFFISTIKCILLHIINLAFNYFFMHLSCKPTFYISQLHKVY